MKEFQGFTRVCKYSDLKEKVGRRFIIDDVELALFKVDGKVYALSNICLHQKASIIYDGIIENGKITCPAHGWQYDLKTGIIAGGIKGLDVYEVKIHNNDIFVKVFEKKLKW